MPQFLSLSALQREFQKVLKKPRDKSLVKNFITVTKTFSKKERLGVYQYAYRARILESLKDDFPSLFKKLGEIQFKKLITQYLKKYPSNYWTLAEVGQDLPKFAKTSEHRKLAELEWVKCIVFMLEAPEAFDFSTLSILKPSDLLSGRLRLNPTLHVLKKEGSFLTVFRSQKGVQTYAIPKANTSIFLALYKNQSLSKILKSIEKENIRPEKIFKIFSGWASLGLITSFQMDH